MNSSEQVGRRSYRKNRHFYLLRSRLQHAIVLAAGRTSRVTTLCPSRQQARKAPGAAAEAFRDERAPRPRPVRIALECRCI